MYTVRTVTLCVTGADIMYGAHMCNMGGGEHRRQYTYTVRVSQYNAMNGHLDEHQISFLADHTIVCQLTLPPWPPVQKSRKPVVSDETPSLCYYFDL